MKQSLFSIFFVIFAFSLSLNAQELCRDVFRKLNKKEMKIQLAQSAGLRYLETPELGYARQKTERGVLYIDPYRHQVTDDATIARIEALGIPGAYENVWISMDPRTHLQAKGTDARGRTQYRYHEVWNHQVRDVSKYSRVLLFGEELPRLRAFVATDLARPEMTLEKRLAAVVRLLEVAGVRVGSEDYAAENGSYGLTTLKVEHVKAFENEVMFDFIGKSGVHHKLSVEDAAVSLLIKRLVKEKSSDDTLFEVSSQQVNQYIKDRIGDFTAKDFRTWVATTTAARILHERGPPRDEVEKKSNEKAAAFAASERLHNTPEVCRDAYIHPTVFEASADGRLDQAFQDSQLQKNERTLEENAVLKLFAK